MTDQETITVDVAIIGAGPAGLMAAETLCEHGIRPHLFDAMPTPARKFLMAGKSGLNLTHSEPIAPFLARYGARAAEIEPALAALSPAALRDWADDLGAETFVGSSGRVFPKVFKASPLLRAWLARLNAAGATLHTRRRWQGWGSDKQHIFDTPSGTLLVQAKATIFALGGASWPKLGADGTWADAFRAKGIAVTPFRPANCGFDIGWTSHMAEKFAGAPVKGCVLMAGDETTKGDFVITRSGIEGSAVYTLSAPIRDMLEHTEDATLYLDLSPDRNRERLTAALQKPKGKKSFATHLKRATGLAGVKAALLREFAPKAAFNDPALLAAAIKQLPLKPVRPRPIEEAISAAGGISFDALDEDLMVKALPGTYCAGEMLDWEAPTGGYLLTASIAQGKQAALGALKHLK